MEDYEKKYEEALGRANAKIETYNHLGNASVVKSICEIFPELKESEDEKIKKDIINFLSTPFVKKGMSEDRLSTWISWLEKQDQKKHEEELENAYKCADEVQYRKGYEDAKREFESQGEQNNKHLYDVIIALWDLLDKIDTFSDLQIDDTNPDNPFKKIEYIAQERHKFVKSDGYNLYIQGEQITDFKQSKQKPADKCIGCNNFKVCITCIDGDQYAHITEQKPSDKVEPKFHAGDFITDGERIFQIKETVWERNNRNDGSTYCESLIVNLRDGNTYADNTDLKEYHLWTIQDAKDGDVLAYVTDEGDLWIMIYESLYEPYEGHVHYHALLVNDNFIDKGTCCICIDDLKPATKGQRELLFSKMKEAGYEWDADKKELKKIEQKSINSQFTPEQSSVLDKHIDKFIEQKPAWSEEDDDNMRMIEDRLSDYLDYIREDSTLTKHQKNFLKEKVIGYVNWLKSLKERYNWKPSDEQMRPLGYAIDYFKKKRNDTTYLEYLYQDLKKLREE